jgi:hypothetical protein
VGGQWHQVCTQQGNVDEQTAHDQPILASIEPEHTSKEDHTMIDEVATHTVYATQTGIGIGSAIAIVCSWQRNRSILWAILAGVLSWFYVFYFAVTRKPEERK